MVFVFLLLSLLGGMILGLLPLLIGRAFDKPGLGRLGMLCTVLSSLLLLQLPTAIGFTIAVFVKRTDYQWHNAQPPVQRVVVQEALPSGASLNLVCLSGPLRGQLYPVGRRDVSIGCDPACTVHIPEGTPGVSHRHCVLRWQQGILNLTDTGSSYGTFLGDGRKLPPHYPTQVSAGSRFYLGTTGCLFQLTLP